MKSILLFAIGIYVIIKRNDFAVRSLQNKKKLFGVSKFDNMS